MDFTESLINGAELPSHPADTTAKRIVSYGKVYDAIDETPLTASLHQNELRMLAEGEQMNLTHLYRYGIFNNRIFHTRQSVIIAVVTEDAEL